MLKSVRRQQHSGEIAHLSAADPLNLTGIVLPGPRVPAVAANTVTYTDGAVPSSDGETVTVVAQAEPTPRLTPR